jgi:glycosyltransferase involved in cell wall biosynthesis
MAQPLSLVRPVLGVAALAAGTAAIVPSIYLAFVTGAACATASRPDHRRSPGSSPPLRFAVCVPAHNEAANIDATVRALLGQRYSCSGFQVHVVADNCDDRTAEIARCAGAIVHERHDPSARGKGAALNWLIERLDAETYDALVVIDADTLADRDFLASVNAAFERGACAVQGHYGVLDPEASAHIGLRYAALACRHHLRPLGRMTLGASSGLYGNGMAFLRATIAGRRWSNHLVEDAEFQNDLLLDGYLVAYAPDAVVRAEMPASLDAATSQNARWELGRAQLVRRYVPPLAKRMIVGGPLPRRVYADAVADHITPPLSVQASLDVLSVAVGALALAAGSRRSAVYAVGGGLAASAALIVHVLAGLRLARAPRSVYRSLLAAPRAVLWKLGLIGSLALDRSAVSWQRTTRNAAHVSSAAGDTAETGSRQEHPDR